MCGAWDSLFLPPLQIAPKVVVEDSYATAESLGVERRPSGFWEFDRVLGGGIPDEAGIVLSGAPGIGKSTLLGQVLIFLSRQELVAPLTGPAPKKHFRVLYASGEESVGQINDRLRRIGLTPGDEETGALMVVNVSTLEEILAIAQAFDPHYVVVDSVSVIRTTSIDGAAGTVAQVREVTRLLSEHSKKLHFTYFLIGHVTKDGSLAGPKVLEHLVDIVLSFEGEEGHPLRTLRSTKNRFGTQYEIGMFEMGPKGLVEVKNPSSFYLQERNTEESGNIVAALTPDGNSRAMLVEVQALVIRRKLSVNGKRRVTGITPATLDRVLAILDRRAGILLKHADVYINVAGGLIVDEPAMDLPLAIAITSAAVNERVHEKLVAFGEIGLSGEIRGVTKAVTRIQESRGLEFQKILTPTSAEEAARAEGVDLEGIVACKNIADALCAALPESFAPATEDRLEESDKEKAEADLRTFEEFEEEQKPKKPKKKKRRSKAA